LRQDRDEPEQGDIKGVRAEDVRRRSQAAAAPRRRKRGAGLGIEVANATMVNASTLVAAPVASTISRPGAIHLLNGLYDARMDHQPVLASLASRRAPR
jgi:hypothetical protein